MRVLFDFYEIALGKGKSIGIYNYALAVLKELSQNPDIELIVACSGANETIIREIPNIEIKVISQSFPSTYNRLIWRFLKVIKLTKGVKADIYYSPKGFAPGFSKRTKAPFIVLTVHDMIPFNYMEKNPGYFGVVENQLITKMLKHSIDIANNTITVSEFSKEMISKYCQTDSNVQVIYNGVSVPNTIEKDNTLAPYIFAITSKLPHKNKDLIIKGYLDYRKIATNPLPLKVCGISKEQVEIPPEFDNYIDCIDFAEEKQFATLFSNASLFLFLPKIEGFGFPPLEALLYDVPIVVSDIPVLTEVLGTSALFVDPENSIEIGEGINSVLTNPEIRKQILNAGSIITKKYTWKNCAKEIAQVFEKTVS